MKLQLLTRKIPIVSRILIFLSILPFFITSDLFSQENYSILLNNNLLTIKANGLAFLGSGITEDDAKILAINDAKRTALEQAGTYLESHTEVLNYQLVKDEIITFSGSVLKVNILKEERKLINNMFALSVDIVATIDTKLLDQRIQEIKKEYSLQKQLEYERESNRKLEARIVDLQDSGSTASEQEVKNVINQLNSVNWFNKAYNTKNKNLQIEYYTQAILLNPQYAAAYNNRGLVYKKLGQYNTAITDFNFAIGSDNNFAAAYNNRGLVYNELGQYEKAIEDCNKAIVLDPNYPNAYENRGAAFHFLNQYERAIADFNKAIKLNLQDDRIYCNRGIVYVELGQLDMAINDFTKSIEINPQNSDAFTNRGHTFKLLGKYKKAIDDCNLAISLDPQNSKAYHTRAYSYSNIGKYETAITDYNKSIELNPADVTAYTNRGTSYFKLNQFDLAITDFTNSVKIDPKYPNAYLGRGLSYQMLGDNKAAASDYNEYLRLNGNKSDNAEVIRGLIRDLGYTPNY